MFEQEIVLYGFTLSYGRMQALDIPDEQFADQPAAGVNHPAWIFGHLSISTDYALKQLGAETHCPPEWFKLFGPGSQAEPDRAKYPAKKTLLDAWKAGHEQVLAALPSADPAKLAAPHTLPMELLRKAFPRTRDLLAHLLTTHEAAHLGQLSMWRRLKGMKPLF